MLPLLLASVSLAAAPSLDTTKVCAAEGRVAASPGLQRRLPSRCAAAVPGQTIADYMRAFALYSRELAEPGNAARLLRTVEARWLLVEDGKGFLVFDAEADAFVDPSVFQPGPPADETPAARAYREGYTALRGKRYDEARTQLTTCIGLEPDHAGCHWELGWVHWVAEDWAAAATAWSEVERVAPDHPELDVWLPKARAKVAP